MIFAECLKGILFPTNAHSPINLKETAYILNNKYVCKDLQKQQNTQKEALLGERSKHILLHITTESEPFIKSNELSFMYTGLLISGTHHLLLYLINFIFWNSSKTETEKWYLRF